VDQRREVIFTFAAGIVGVHEGLLVNVEATDVADTRFKLLTIKRICGFRQCRRPPGL
jgi:hypothetical protein